MRKTQSGFCLNTSTIRCGELSLEEKLSVTATADHRGMLSVELFNREYWAQEALTVAKTGLEKTRAIVAEAVGA